MKFFERFKKKKPTIKVGENPSSEISSPTSSPTSSQIESKYYISFPSLDGEPTFELSDKLSIGSEVGDVVLEDESISPRHCTITHNQDVICLMDHNSSTGTFIGKKELGPGRMYILQDKDKIKLGDLPMEVFHEEVEVPLTAGQNAALNQMSPVDQTADLPVINSMETLVEEAPEVEIPDLELAPIESNEANEANEASDEEVLDLTQEGALESAGQVFEPEGEVNVKKSKIRLPFGGGEPAPESSSALVRLLGLLCDVLIVLIVHMLLSPFKAFEMFVTDFPLMIWSGIAPFYEAQIAPVVKQFIADYPAVGEMLKDFNQQLDDYIVVAHMLFLFVMLRVVTTLIFGVSLGQILVGIRAYGNVVLKRLLGAVRELIGIFTMPFIIFDLGTIFNIRSFKEIITFTRITTPFLGRSIIASVVVLPLLIILYLVSPLFQGLEFRMPSPVVSSAFKPAKKISVDKNYQTSEYMQLTLSLDEQIKVYPNFQFEKKGSKTIYHPSLLLDIRKNGKVYEFSKKKKFDLKKLIRIAFGFNPMAKMNYPHLSKYLYDVSSNNKNFKQQRLDKLAFAEEFKSLMITSMELAPDKLIDHIVTHGPLIKGYVDFRDSLYQMLGGNIKGVELQQLGDNYFVFFDIDTGKDFEFKFIPLIAKEGSIYSISTSSRGLTTKTIKKLFEQSIWSVVENKDENPVNYFRFIDSMSSKENTSEEKLVSFLQGIYQRIYADIKLTIEGQIDTKQWEQSLIRTLKVLDETKLKQEKNQAVWSKFYQNLSDALQALKEKDLQFFSIESKKA